MLARMGYVTRCSLSSWIMETTVGLCIAALGFLDTQYIKRDGSWMEFPGGNCHLWRQYDPDRFPIIGPINLLPPDILSRLADTTAADANVAAESVQDLSNLATRWCHVHCVTPQALWELLLLDRRGPWRRILLV